ncbi:MAG: hypothetical protein EAZ99_05020 [Alphaproteobacteria bacterium]|nr:MAG: hypothetical protein EAZ99_05020 [Alphaproteobacteria bacterium]
MEYTAPALLRRLTRPLLGMALATLMAGCVTAQTNRHSGYYGQPSYNAWHHNNAYRYDPYAGRSHRHRERHCQKRDVRWYQPWRSRC